MRPETTHNDSHNGPVTPALPLPSAPPLTRSQPRPRPFQASPRLCKRLIKSKGFGLPNGLHWQRCSRDRTPSTRIIVRAIGRVVRWGWPNRKEEKAGATCEAINRDASPASSMRKNRCKVTTTSGRDKGAS
jgi:hypothetical protein